MFLQWDARLGAVSFVGALRFDRHPLGEISRTISPRGAVVWRVRDTTSLRLTSGTSFRSPTYSESYTELEQPNGNAADALYFLTEGNRQLVPERIFTAELGLRDESSSIHTADATIYLNRVSQLIGLTDLVPEPAPFYIPEENGFLIGSTGFENEENLYTGFGTELDGHLFPVNGLDLHANVHLQRILEDAGQQVITEQSASAMKVNLRAGYASPFRLDVFAGIHYVSSQVWRLRDFSDDGTLVINPVTIPARTIPSIRLATRLLEDESLALAGTVWHPSGLADTSGGFRGPPKRGCGHGRAYGATLYRY